MIELRNIAASSRGLRDVSFRVKAGQRLALVGANGSGKSTILHAIVGLQQISDGSVSVDDLNPFDKHQAQEVRRRVGYVQQRPDDQIVATSVEDDVAFGPENLGLPASELRSRVDEVLACVGLTGLEKREPHTLSGGQKQRLVIAGVLALHPNYLVLDEPTAQLDPAGRESVLAVLDKLQEQGTGIVQVTHDIEEMALADRIAVLHEGSIVFEGSFEELQAQREHFDVWGIDSGLTPVELSSFAGSDKEKRTLRAENLSLSYRVGTQVTQALKDASFEVSSGEFIVIRGDTGSGKSTLLSILAGLVQPDEGTVTAFAGHDGEGATGSDEQSEARLVFQDPELQLFSETVLDDIAFGPRNLGMSAEDAQGAARAAMQQVGLSDDFADRSPFLLSGGEARRAAIAGIIAMKPRFFLADEPTSALDAQGRDKIRALLASLTATSGVIVVTHNPEQFADIATRTYRIVNGTLSLIVDDERKDIFAQLPSASVHSVRKHSLRDASLTSLPSSYPIPEGIDVTVFEGEDRDTSARSAIERQRIDLPMRYEDCAEVSLSSPELTPKVKKGKGAGGFNFSLYVPGDSLLHRADPRTKIVAAALIMTALFSYLNWLPILGVLLLVIALALSAKIPLGSVFKMMRPLIFLIAFTLLIHSITWQPFGLSLEGFARGGLFTLRLVDVMMLSLLVTLTTSPVALTDGLTLLMKPLRKIRVPIDDIAMMLSIALRFIPTIMEEAMTIVRAQTARAAPFNSGKMLARLKAWIPVIIPLLVQLFRRADTLALAMEARCYMVSADIAAGKQPVRTRLRSLKMKKSDYLIIALAILFTLAIIVVPRI